MGLTVHFEVLNQLGTPMMYSATLANQPAAGIAGRIFFRTDSPYGIYRDNGTSWDQIAGSGGGGGVTGSGTATQVAFWSSSSAITSSTNLYWDNINSRLGINNATPGAPLDVHSTGTNAQFNGTGTNNAFLVFQNAGVSKWQIGNVYSAGSNYFRIYDSVNAVERFTVQNTGSISTTTNITASGASTGFQGLYNSNTVTIPAATTFGSGGYTYVGYNQFYSQSFGGSATYQNNNIDTAIFGLNRIDFSAAGGTVTMTQATGARAMSAAAYQVQYGGTNSGTITHLAGQQILGFYRSAGTGTLSVTNAYGLLINNIDDYGAGFTYTNRWGIFQQGSSDNNYFAGKVLINTSTVSTYNLDVAGTGRFTGALGFQGIAYTTALPTTTLQDYTFSLYFSGGADYKFGIDTSFFVYSKTNAGFRLYDQSNTLMPPQLTSGGFSCSSAGRFFFSSGTTADPTNNAQNGTIELNNSANNYYKIGISNIRSSKYDIYLQTGGTSGGGFRFYQGTTELATIFQSGNLGLNTSGTDVSSAILFAVSTTKGFLPPVMTTTQKNAITTPAAGLIVFDSTLAKLCVYSGSAWQTITSV